MKSRRNGRYVSGHRPDPRDRHPVGRRRLRRGPQHAARQAQSRAATRSTRETQIIANNGTYGTRQSNKKDGDGGGAIYGCRSAAGKEPCIRSNNLKDGEAFEFETKGKSGGSITVGDTTGAPFTTNATGHVANLDSDKLDGKDSTEFAGAGDLLFAAVAEDGTLAAGRGATASVKTRRGDLHRDVQQGRLEVLVHRQRRRRLVRRWHRRGPRRRPERQPGRRSRCRTTPARSTCRSSADPARSEPAACRRGLRLLLLSPPAARRARGGAAEHRDRRDRRPDGGGAARACRARRR